ncbi:hypothetical protein FQV39_16005 [Bosea sp. F3-2]|uniref:hypothetical protein n=1 Tax=Bosea sp. F3-2 TaxID=2599640 RepID=UPI0011ECDE13|nr:hypothetical protein [Bosea sp. F3-2]QEL23909.1 hypothetical protein FQV39_16005 [Bosea sp. F3-2]
MRIVIEGDAASRHCERSEAIQGTGLNASTQSPWIASSLTLLAMTSEGPDDRESLDDGDRP